MTVHMVSDESFEEDVLQSSTPVVVYFWAEWSSVCKTITPTLEGIAEDIDPDAKIVKINMDENASTPSRYGVSTVPTLIVFKGGQVEATKTGGIPKGALASWIQASI